MKNKENRAIFHNEVRIFQRDLAKLVSDFHKRIFESEYDDELKVNILIGTCTAAIRSLFGMMGFLGAKYFSDEDMLREFSVTIDDARDAFNQGGDDYHSNMSEENNPKIESSIRKIKEPEIQSIQTYVSKTLDDIINKVSGPKQN